MLWPSLLTAPTIINGGMIDVVCVSTPCELSEAASVDTSILYGAVNLSAVSNHVSSCVWSQDQVNHTRVQSLRYTECNAIQPAAFYWRYPKIQCQAYGGETRAFGAAGGRFLVQCRYIQHRTTTKGVHRANIRGRPQVQNTVMRECARH